MQKGGDYFSTIVEDDTAEIRVSALHVLTVYVRSVIMMHKIKYSYDLKYVRVPTKTKFDYQSQYIVIYSYHNM